MKKTRFVAGVLAVGAIAVFASLAQRTERAASAKTLTIAMSSELTPPSESGTVSYGEFLRAYWGPKWPHFEAQLREDQNAALSKRIRPEDVPPWEIVAPDVRQRLRENLQAQRPTWGQQFVEKGELDPIGSVLNPLHKILSVPEMNAIRAIVGQFATSIDALSNQVFDLVVEAEEQIWDGGLYQNYPLIAFGQDAPSPSASRLVLIRKWVHFPWLVEYTIDSSSRPELESVLKRLVEIRRRQVQAIRAYIAGL